MAKKPPKDSGAKYNQPTSEIDTSNNLRWKSIYKNNKLLLLNRKSSQIYSSKRPDFDWNPLLYLDFLGILLFFSSGFGYLGKVRFNPAKFKHGNLGVALMSAAGPLANFMTALFFGLLIIIFNNQFQSNPILRIILAEFFTINLGMAIFNLLPIPPLDGSKIFMYIIPDSIGNLIRKFQSIIVLIGLSILIFLAFIPSSPFTKLILSGMKSVARLFLPNI